MRTAFARIRIRNGIGPLIEVVVLVLIVNVALILRNRFLIEQEGVIGKQFDRFVVFHRNHSIRRRPLQRSREWKPPDMTVQKTAVAVHAECRAYFNASDYADLSSEYPPLVLTRAPRSVHVRSLHEFFSTAPTYIALAVS
jgi:hypothetical protein